MDNKISRNYEFGAGTINNVLNGFVNKFEYIEDIKPQKQLREIIIPKVIGVYQTKSQFQENPIIKIQNDEVDNEIIFRLRKDFETIHPDLISIVYDSSNIPYEILCQTMDRDILKRVNLIESLYLPDFYEKNVPDASKSIQRLQNRKDFIKDSIVNRDKEILIRAKDEFGLTRHEAVELIIAENFLNRPIQSDIIVSPTNTRVINFPKNFNFE